jgi:hypothetical protein
MTNYVEFYNRISKNVTHCPKTGLKGQPVPGNPLVWYVVTKDRKNQKQTRYWSYATGRTVAPEAQDTNVT